MIRLERKNRKLMSCTVRIGGGTPRPCNYCADMGLTGTAMPTRLSENNTWGAFLHTFMGEEYGVDEGHGLFTVRNPGTLLLARCAQQ